MVENKEDKSIVSNDPLSDTKKDLEEITAVDFAKISDVVKTEVRILVQESYSGPIPSSSELANYEKILSGSADRIIAMAEKEQSHGHVIKEKILKHQSKDSTLAVGSAFLTVLFVLGLIYFSIVNNMPWVAAALGGTTIVSLAAIFMKGKKKA